tara:strand:- start:68 stop:217 length:150 start_codon:yes stop_codon:yes gene_type:complete
MDNILSCPYCKNLLYEDIKTSKLNCEICSIAFDVKEGIPILLPKTVELL